MTGVRAEYQGAGVGRQLKWAQRERALAEGVKFIKWTFEPVKARNAYFNLEKLGAIVTEYERNFYGTDYAIEPESGNQIGLQSDRLFAEWHLEGSKVTALAAGELFIEEGDPVAEVAIVNDWSNLVRSDPAAGLELQVRIRRDFEGALARGLIARGFRRGLDHPAYIFFKD